MGAPHRIAAALFASLATTLAAATAPAPPTPESPSHLDEVFREAQLAPDPDQALARFDQLTRDAERIQFPPRIPRHLILPRRMKALTETQRLPPERLPELGPGYARLFEQRVLRFGGSYVTPVELDWLGRTTAPEEVRRLLIRLGARLDIRAVEEGAVLRTTLLASMVSRAARREVVLDTLGLLVDGLVRLRPDSPREIYPRPREVADLIRSLPEPWRLEGVRRVAGMLALELNHSKDIACGSSLPVWIETGYRELPPDHARALAVDLTRRVHRFFGTRYLGDQGPPPEFVLRVVSWAPEAERPALLAALTARAEIRGCSGPLRGSDFGEFEAQGVQLLRDSGASPEAIEAFRDQVRERYQACADRQGRPRPRAPEWIRTFASMKTGAPVDGEATRGSFRIADAWGHHWQLFRHDGEDWVFAAELLAEDRVVRRFRWSKWYRLRKLLGHFD